MLWILLSFNRELWVNKIDADMSVVLFALEHPVHALELVLAVSRTRPKYEPIRAQAQSRAF